MSVTRADVVILTVMVAIGTLVGLMVADTVTPVAHAEACKIHPLVELIEADGRTIYFTPAQITAVMPNAGDYPNTVHAVIGTGDSHEYGVQENVDEVAAEIRLAECL
jgi:hypothetical protein